MTLHNETTPREAANAVTPIAGLHHVTAITGNAQQNIDFYTKTLGLRFVKVTINYDDPGSYHFYYGDGLGRPGTIMTYFAWPGARRGTNGVGQVSETAFAIPVGSADYWKERLDRFATGGAQHAQRFGEKVVTFQDPEGMPLALVETEKAAGDRHAWRHGEVPVEHAIRGFHSVTLAELTESAPAGILVNQFGYREVGREGKRVRYQAAPPHGDAIARVVDVVTVPKGNYPQMGAGQVHHVAFRTPDDGQQALWLEQLRKAGRNVSPVMDRDYFHSIYFREPGGVLFEIATDAPGMTINEKPEELATRIQLPAWLEPHRVQVEAALPKITLAPRFDGLAAEEV
ncbi:MAG TPA: ring-cleaving dioxygenase [Phycisphaerae bacterium]|nr:ring-cleaving dioxygenase [Phycisphaerae bacterium]